MYVEAIYKASNKFSSFQRKIYRSLLRKDESAVNFDNVLTNIESLAKDDPYGYRKADPYWARVWGQTEQFKSQDGLLQLVKQTTSGLEKCCLKADLQIERSWIFDKILA